MPVGTAGPITIVFDHDVPIGSLTQISATIGTLTAISGVQHTQFGRYLLMNARSLEGGVPLTAYTQFVIFSALAYFVNTQATAQYSVAGITGTLDPWLMGALRLRLIGTALYGVNPATVLPPGFICQAIT